MDNIIYLRTQRGKEYIVGENCQRIEENLAAGLAYDVYDQAGGIILRIFDPVEVCFEWIED